MVVQVKAKVDLLNLTTGAIEVPVDQLGVVDGIVLPPKAVQVRVTFSLPAPVIRWVSLGEIIFLDGPIGPAKAAVELAQSPEVVESFTYPNKISDTDVIIGEQFAFDRAVMQIKFVSGLIFELKGDINTGEIAVTLKGSVV